MLKPNTVFVLGAALSAELGLPLGWQLKDQIMRLIPRNGATPDEPFADLIHANEQTRSALDNLRAALPLAASIDNLVEHRGDNDQFVSVSKWAIARAISKAELACPLGIKVGERTLPTDNSYAALFQLIVGGVPRHRMEQAFSRLHVVTFNYDRTLEVFLHRAIIAYSGVTADEATGILDQATIVHAYGALGASEEGSVRPRGFRDDRAWQRIAADANGLRTFSEKEDSESIMIIRRELQAAERMVMLGCAFHPQNLRLIQPDITRLSMVYATAYAPPPADRDGHAAPPFDKFSLQQGASLERAVSRWHSQQDHVPSNLRFSFHIEAMTCRQLIALHGGAWTE